VNRTSHRTVYRTKYIFGVGVGNYIGYLLYLHPVSIVFLKKKIYGIYLEREICETHKMKQRDLVGEDICLVSTLLILSSGVWDLVG
jgi:hypothetical protein